MAGSLRALIVEDAENDALLLLHELRRGGYEPAFVRVDTADGLRAALSDQPWDIVLSDWAMPQFSAREAFTIARAADPDIPFMIVSGTIGEDTAVEAMRTGVNDFFVKGRLSRLVPAIERELREAGQRRHRKTMERQLAQRQEEAIQLELARAQAERENAFKSRFLASMSHELRTPLNGIIGFAELLQQEIVAPLTTQQKEYVDNVLQSADHLLKLINDILDLSKVEAGRMELRIERVALAVVTDAVRSVLHTLAQRRGVELEFVVPAGLPDIDADAVRLKQILYNLVSNGIKFTPKGGRVRLSARVDAGRLCIDVADTGIGIAAADMPRLFREFEQLEPVRQGVQEGVPEGTGLGLALTRRLVALHGGSLSVDSTPGAGSTFTVVLPLAWQTAVATP